MLPQHVLVALASAIAVSGLPLNINLGAYSPALVVGDGEISFGGNAERASQVLQTLATGAQNGATGAATGQIGGAGVGGGAGGAGGAGAGGEAARGNEPLTAAPGAPRPAGAPAEAPQGAGIGSPLIAPAGAPPGGVAPPETNAAEVAQSSLTPPEFISHKIGGGFDPSRKYPNLMKRDDGLSDLVKRGNDIASSEVAKKKLKRDLDGFRQALTFASDALRNGPRVELGTENAGIGILVNAGSAVPVNSAANGAQAGGEAARGAGGQARIARRDVTPEPENKLGVTLIAIGEI